jgi:hypothetical protein
MLFDGARTDAQFAGNFLVAAALQQHFRICPSRSVTLNAGNSSMTSPSPSRTTVLARNCGRNVQVTIERGCIQVTVVARWAAMTWKCGGEGEDKAECGKARRAFPHWAGMRQTVVPDCGAVSYFGVGMEGR